MENTQTIEAVLLPYNGIFNISSPELVTVTKCNMYKYSALVTKGKISLWVGVEFVDCTTKGIAAFKLAKS